MAGQADAISFEILGEALIAGANQYLRGYHARRLQVEKKEVENSGWKNFAGSLTALFSGHGWAGETGFHRAKKIIFFLNKLKDRLEEEALTLAFAHAVISNPEGGKLKDALLNTLKDAKVFTDNQVVTYQTGQPRLVIQSQYAVPIRSILLNWEEKYLKHILEESLRGKVELISDDLDHIFCACRRIDEQVHKVLNSGRNDMIDRERFFVQVKNRLEPAQEGQQRLARILHLDS